MRVLKLLANLCAVASLIAVACVSGYTSLVWMLRCDENCGYRSSPWTENPNSWQWHAGLLAAVLLILWTVLVQRGIRRLDLVQAAIGLVGQIASIGLLWYLLVSAEKAPIAHQLVTYGVVIVVGGVLGYAFRRQADEYA